MPSPRCSASVIASKTQLTTSSARAFVRSVRRAERASINSLFVIPFASPGKPSNLSIHPAFPQRQGGLVARSQCLRVVLSSATEPPWAWTTIQARVTSPPSSTGLAGRSAQVGDLAASCHDHSASGGPPRLVTTASVADPAPPRWSTRGLTFHFLVSEGVGPRGTGRAMVIVASPAPRGASSSTRASEAQEDGTSTTVARPAEMATGGQSASASNRYVSLPAPGGLQKDTE